MADAEWFSNDGSGQAINDEWFSPSRSDKEKDAEPVEQPDKPTRKPPVKLVPLNTIRISEDVITPDGDTVMVSRTADNVIKDIDSRIDGLKKLAGCIRG